MTVRILIGDCIDQMRTLPDGSVNTCVTSPPYFGLRDYQVEGQIGLEATPAVYVERLVEVFRDVRRVLRDDGTLWLNLGDSYAGSWGAQSREHAGKHAPNVAQISANQIKAAQLKASGTGSLSRTPGLKPKDLIGIPWRVAFALQDDGWYLRSDIVWHKPNPMPESVTDRPTKAHEYLFLLSKSERYFYDAAAISEPVETGFKGSTFDGARDLAVRPDTGRKKRSGNLVRKPGNARGCPEGSGSNVCGSVPWEGETRNKRSVWTVATTPFREAHFATFPPALIEPCILAGSQQGGVVLDPFSGAGTTGLVADRLQRSAILIELNPEYAAMARRRIEKDAGMLGDVA